MKQIALLFMMALAFQACQSGSDSTTEDTRQQTAETNEFTRIEDGPINSFTVVPNQYRNCKAVFAQSEDELASGNYILATDLDKSCVIAIDGRIVEVDIRSKQVANPTSQFYKYEGNGYRIDLEIRQTEIVAHDLKKVRAQLRIFSDSGFRDIFYIMGEIEC